MFARVKAIARRHGGACMSTDYVDAATHLRWRCEEGHEWEAVPGSIATGTWCGRCAGVAQLSLEDMQETARARGGNCISRSYVNHRTPLLWRCAEGHEWTARPGNVRHGSWCPHCARRAPKTIADMQAMAAERGGQCISTTIDTVSDPLRWRCRVGHVFESNANGVQQGGWCPRCRKVPTGSLERLRRAVARRGGELLETEYTDSKTPVRVRCREGHEWAPTPERLLAGNWCRACFHASQVGRPVLRLGIADMQDVAARRGGRCLSDTYVNSETKLRWQCHAGHEWDGRPSQIRHGHWCPICAHRHRGTIHGMRALAAERGGECLSRVYLNHGDPLQFVCARGHAFTATGRAVKSGAWCPTCGEWELPERERRRSQERADR